MVKFQDILEAVCDLLGKRPDEVGEVEFGVLRRAISTAIQAVWTYAWWPQTMVKRRMLPGVLYGGPLWQGVLTYYPPAGRWYQYLSNEYQSDPPAVQDVNGKWLANLPYWAEYSTRALVWDDQAVYPAGSRVQHGGLVYVASEQILPGIAPGGAQAGAEKWVRVTFPAPYVYVHQYPYPPAARVRGIWRSPLGGWEMMVWGDEAGGGYLFSQDYEDGQDGWRVYDSNQGPAGYVDAMLAYQIRFPDLTGAVYDPTKAYRPPHWPLLPNAPAPKVATPTFTPTEGNFGETVQVTITTGTPGATIYYTTNGSTPTEGSPVYTGPITLTTTTTVKAMAAKGGMTNSDVASKTYTKSMRVYWGPGSSTDLDEAGILALAYNVVLTSPAGNYTFGDNAPPKYLFLAWPNDWPQPRTTDGFMAGGLPMSGDMADAADGYDQIHNGWPYKLVTVAGKAHRLYRTKYLQELGITITVNV
jgi:hypothetical protein